MQMQSYVQKAGGCEKAVSDLKAFYKRKFEPPDIAPPNLPMSLYLSRVGSVPACPLFTMTELAQIVHGMKSGKSTGADGVSYELLTGSDGVRIGPAHAGLLE